MLQVNLVGVGQYQLYVKTLFNLGLVEYCTSIIWHDTNMETKVLSTVYDYQNISIRSLASGIFMMNDFI